MRLFLTSLFFVAGLCNLPKLWAQSRYVQNQPTYQSKPYHFGFYIGLNYYDFLIDHEGDLGNYPNFKAAITQVSPGYHVGIISDLRLAHYLNLRFNPTFSTMVRRIEFDAFNPNFNRRDIYLKEIESSFVELPIELKFSSKRIANYNWYVLGGIRYNIDLASQEKVQDDEIFKLTNNDFSYEFGIGIDIYFEFFKMSPQLKAGWGMANLLVDDGSVYVEHIDRITTRSLLFAITFE